MLFVVIISKPRIRGVFEISKLLNLILIIFLFCLFPIKLVNAEIQQVPTFNFDSIEGLYDIPATGEYEGYRKLMSHKLDKYYDVFFTYESKGSIFSYHIKTVPLKVLDMNEIITVVFPNGESQSASRNTWYKVFRSNRDGILSDFFLRNYYDLYAEWAFYDSGIQVEHIAERYIKKTYDPTNNNNNNQTSRLLPNTKVYKVD